MTSQDIANAILLRESGELSPEATAELEAALENNPEARQMAEEFAVLQTAGRDASQHSVPPVSDLTLETLRNAAGPTPSFNRISWLALAAGLVVLISFLPFILPPSTPPSLIDSPMLSAGSVLDSEADFSAELAALERDIAAWSDTTTSDLLQVADEAYWAEQLLNSEDSI